MHDTDRTLAEITALDGEAEAAHFEMEGEFEDENFENPSQFEFEETEAEDSESAVAKYLRLRFHRGNKVVRGEVARLVEDCLSEILLNRDQSLFPRVVGHFVPLFKHIVVQSKLRLQGSAPFTVPAIRQQDPANIPQNGIDSCHCRSCAFVRLQCFVYLTA